MAVMVLLQLIYLDMLIYFKNTINKYRKYFRFRNYIPKFKFNRVLSEILLDRIDRLYFMDWWSIKPFNGQVRRTLVICLIAKDFEPNLAIETGTYFGTTTTYLCGLVTERTFTIEINQKYASAAKRRFDLNFSDFKIDCVTGDSEIEITKILSTVPNHNKNVIAYLDAHWTGKVPTTTEIEALYNWGNNWIAIVDDFKVDSDLGYGFDVHDGFEVNLSTIPKLPGLQVWVPRESSKLETGARRGTAYIFTEKSISQITQSTLANLQRIR